MKKKLNRNGFAVKKVNFEDLTEGGKEFILSAATKHRKIVLRELSPEEARKKEEEKMALVKRFNIEMTSS